MRKRNRLLFTLILMLTLCAALPALGTEAADIPGYAKATGYTYVAFGHYPTDADGAVQPILWRVLQNEAGTAYLLSEYILFPAPLHADYNHYTGWESSDLYAYLNSTFKNDAFTAAEQQALVPCAEDGALVTLLSGDEMKSAAIGFASNADRLCESTDYAKQPRATVKETLYLYQKGGKRYSPWWSRTRSSKMNHQQQRVMDEGAKGVVSVGNKDLGVRPAVYVDMSLLNVMGGSGAKGDPYYLASGEAAAAPIAAASPMAVPQPTAIPAASLAAMQKPVATAWPSPTAQPQSSQPAKTPVQPAVAGYTDAANPETINARFPELTAEGFLPEGESEFVLEDTQNGLWLYASQSLRIEINRRTGTNSKKQPLRWYEAHIYTKDPGEMFRFYPWNEEKYTNYNVQTSVDKIAAKHHLVFATNSDYFIYRVERAKEEKSYAYPIGVVIREGEILFDVPRKAGSTVYPPLDVMALYPNGSIALFRNGEKTAQEVLETGAANALSFGPILVENGEVSPRSTEFGNTPNPRTAFGMVSPGHYVSLMVESRITESKGEGCVWVGKKMAELGCTLAINMDGGATSTMLFMGKQINKTANYGDITNRQQNELFGIGYSEAVK